jgi:hypothetical protein
MQHDDDYVQAVIESGDRLPASMYEADMPEQILSNPIYDGSAIVEDEGK